MYHNFWHQENLAVRIASSKLGNHWWYMQAGKVYTRWDEQTTKNALTHHRFSSITNYIHTPQQGRTLSYSFLFNMNMCKTDAIRNLWPCIRERRVQPSKRYANLKVNVVCDCMTKMNVSFYLIKYIHNNERNMEHILTPRAKGEIQDWVRGHRVKFKELALSKYNAEPKAKKLTELIHNFCCGGWRILFTIC